MSLGLKITLLIKFKMAAGGILDLYFRHISITNEHTFVKFGMLTDVGCAIVISAQSSTFIEIQDGDSRHLGFWFLH